VISSSQNVETSTAPTAGSLPSNPYHNPSYPERTHLLDGTQLEIALRSCNERINSALQKLNALASHAQKPLFVCLFHQMQGARDQAAEAVRRIPLEAGDLYHEDQERFQQAMEALDRVWQRWEKAGG
jgi:hypothetical protein